MYGPPRPLIPNNMHWNYQPPHNPQWRHPGGPRVPFRGQHQRFNHHRPAFQPGNDNYWCETCDRGFPSEDLLRKHLQQHERCNIDGCKFVAHPKVITKHIQMQHSTGLYKKIANINRPEEIERWREERKKKYPTKSNIDKKAAELKERIDRGEKMGLDRNKNRHNKDDSGHNKDNWRHNNDNRPGQGLKRSNNIGNENQRSKRRDTNHNKKPQPPKTLPLIEDNRKLKPFAGILSLQMDSDSEIEDATETKIIDIIDDDDCEVKSIETKSVEASEPTVCVALSSLMCDYSSSNEEDDTVKASDVNLKQEQPTTVQQSNIINLKDLQDDNVSLKQKLPTVRHDDESLVGHILHKKEITETLMGSLEVVNKNQTEIKNENIDKVKEITWKNEDDNDSGPEEVKVVKQDKIKTPPEVTKPKDVIRKKVFTEKKHIVNRPKSKLPSTLLQKLLSKEIQKERNLILQCIRYIRRNNYFDKDE